MPPTEPTGPRCVFCDIVAGTLPADIVFADDVVVAFLDHRPLKPGHTLVVPRVHEVTLADLPPDAIGPFFSRVQHISRLIPVAVGAEGTFVANNNIVSQSVAHLHFHVVPRTKGDGLRGFFWPRSRYSTGEAHRLAGRMRAVFEPYDPPISQYR
jgi:histidine triad (HIT) family protein